MLLSVLVFLQCSLSVSGYGVYSVSDPAPGKEYSSDILVGTSNLYSDGEQLSYSDGNYHTQLLVVEGMLDDYNLGDGFLIGYQWYHKSYDAAVDFINIQLYHLNTLDDGSQFSGNYTLVHETGWHISWQGLNDYYMYEALRYQDSVNNSLVIAVMSQPNRTTAVLADYCTGDNKVILHSSSFTQASIGDSVYFTYTPGTTAECTSFSIQGIFVQSHYANSQHNCVFHTLQSTSEITVSSTSISSSDTHKNWLIRADNEDKGIEVSPTTISLENQPACTEYIDVEDMRNANSYESNRLGRYCGHSFALYSGLFPYMRLYYITESPPPQASFSLKISSIDIEDDGGGIPLITILIIPIGVIIVCVFVATLRHRHRQRMIHQQQQQRQNPQQSYQQQRTTAAQSNRNDNRQNDNINNSRAKYNNRNSLRSQPVTTTTTEPFSYNFSYPPSYEGTPMSPPPSYDSIVEPSAPPADGSETSLRLQVQPLNPAYWAPPPPPAYSNP